jgi:predicted Zn-dependent peptidase
LEPRKKIKKIVEQDDANQSQLTLLCTLNKLTNFERKYVLLVYNEMLGGSSNSLLFDSVREKNSYAYYINSNQKAYDNIMMIYSGIEIGNADNVLKLIKKTMKNIEKGKFQDKILESSKETIVASIKASTDSPAGIINTYYAKILVDSDNFEERIANIQKISREDIINISKKITLHTIYLLEGESKEEPEVDEEN